MALAVGAGCLALALEPSLLQEIVLDLLRRHPLALAADAAEHPVRVLAPLHVQAALLGGSLEAAGGDLIDVDVGDGFGAAAGRRRGRGELLDVESDGGEADRLAGHPADSLESERGLGRVREGLVLFPMRQSCCHGGAIAFVARLNVP